MQVQTIGHDKVNQLRHVRFFKDVHGIVEHMKKHAEILRPKFEAVIDIFEKRLGGLEIGSWTKRWADILSPLTQWTDAQRQSAQRRRRQALS